MLTFYFGKRVKIPLYFDKLVKFAPRYTIGPNIPLVLYYRAKYTPAISKVIKNTPLFNISPSWQGESHVV